MDTSAMNQMQISKIKAWKNHKCVLCYEFRKHGVYVILVILFICISCLNTIGSYINRENLWLDALTKDILTVYDEGLACNNFDKNKLPNIRRYAKDT